ncbi:MAG: ATP synthase subunit I [Desulfuromonadales bacterium]
MTAIFGDNLFAVIIKGSLGLLTVLTVAGYALFSVKIGMGIMVGGAIAITNFFWLRNVIQNVLGLLPGRPVLYTQTRFFVRIFFTGVVLYAVITSQWCSVAGLLVGLSIIVINIFVFSLYGALRAGG